MLKRDMDDRYEILPHTADIGVLARGDTLSDVIANTAYGMFDLMYDLSVVEPETTVVVEAAAETPPELLVDALSELLASSETENLAFVDFKVEIDDLRAVITATGGPAAVVELVGPPVKAVTYHDLRCEWTGSRWESRVIFDV
ncbi:MAG: archease [Actinomycetota bacterium]